MERPAPAGQGEEGAARSLLGRRAQNQEAPRRVARPLARGRLSPSAGFARQPGGPPSRTPLPRLPNPTPKGYPAVPSPGGNPRLPAAATLPNLARSPCRPHCRPARPARRNPPLHRRPGPTPPPPSSRLHRLPPVALPSCGLPCQAHLLAPPTSRGLPCAASRLRVDARAAAQHACVPGALTCGTIDGAGASGRQRFRSRGYVSGG